jgi:RNA polymerase sigma factor (TIGR02999 family)
LPGNKRSSHDPDKLVMDVYNRLRRLARAYMRHEQPGQTLQATELVHEAYMRLQKGDWVWTDRQHFLAIAARAMRQILVERARARGALKRWAGLNRTTLSETLAAAAHDDAILPALDEALSRLEEIDHEQALIIELRYFVGLSIEETADTIGLSAATVKRRWSMARAWLFRELTATAG